MWKGLPLMMTIGRRLIINNVELKSIYTNLKVGFISRNLRGGFIPAIAMRNLSTNSMRLLSTTATSHATAIETIKEFKMETAELARLKYLATKRGILENELIFERFFSNGSWEELINCSNAGEEVELLQAFLEEYDWDIFAWISGQRAVPEPYQSSRMFSLLKASSRKGERRQ